MATVKKMKKAQSGREYMSYSPKEKSYEYTKKVERPEGTRYYSAKHPNEGSAMTFVNFKQRSNPADSTRAADVEKGAFKRLNEQKKGGKTPKTKAKSGKTMLKRADGSTSQRGLWDNIRAAKGSGKKPTAAMLKQEKKIKAKTKK